MTLPPWSLPVPQGYQHWNKGYWVDDNGQPGFAETLIARSLAPDWQARWASSSFGRLYFRTDARKRSPQDLFAQAPPKNVLSILDGIRSSALALAVESLLDARGGCWDVVAWRPRNAVLFLEAKQESESWADALRESQRFWLRAAADAEARCAFAVVEWRMRT